MESFLIYIGKTALAAGVFFLAYLALFQNQKHFAFNRIYLPISLALSFLIPLITFTTVRYIQPVEVATTNSFAYLPEAGAMPQPEFIYQWYHYLFAAYALGIICFLAFLLLGHLKAIKIIRFSCLKELFGAEVNVTKKDVHPFSFFNRIVVSEKTLENPNLEMIVNHEMVHVKERHTLDILFAEILFLFQWFNPFAWLIRDAMRNNLEYLTDNQITKYHNAEAYQLAMVGLAHKKGVAPFLTALNGSQLKNRIIMMKKKTENRYSLLKQLVVLPVLAILVMGLSNKEVKTEFVQTDELSSTASTVEKVKKDLKSMVIVVDGEVIPSSHPKLKNINFSKKFDSGEICKALNLQNVKANTMVLDDEGSPTLYIRTSNYNPGTNLEFEKHTTRNITLNSNKLTKEYYYAIDNKMVSKEEFESKGKKGFTNVIFLSGKDAINKYGEEYNGIIADATSGAPNFVIKKERVIKGKVTNEKGEAIAAATVIVKNSTTGTITDMSGNYEIRTEENSTLAFSMIGYETKEVTLDGKTELNVTLKSDEYKNPGQIVIDVAAKEEGSENDNNTEYKRVINFDTGEVVSFSRIKGKVTNENGEALPGVAIVVEGSTTGTITNIEGDYCIDVSDENSKLIFALPGYGKKKVALVGKSEVSVSLKTDGSAKAGDIIIKNKNQGKVFKLSGDTKNPPLFIVDGKEFKDIEWLTPENVESISVLKDESATALYGDKAKNGAIIIKSKNADKIDGNPLIYVNGKEYDGDINDISPDDIQSMTVLKEKSAVALYGEDAKDGVVIIATKDFEITNMLELRKFIAWRIKYPKRAQENNKEGIAQMFVKIKENGNISSISETPVDNSLFLDEVVVVAYKPKPEEITIATSNGNLEEVFKNETKRVINLMPAINIPEYKGKTVAFTVKFILQ